VSFGQWLLYYLGFYFMQVVVALYTIGSFRWETLMLATASFPIYGRALVNPSSTRTRSGMSPGRRRRRTRRSTSSPTS
jgi:cellulose synthase (UDP-forming)